MAQVLLRSLLFVSLALLSVLSAIDYLGWRRGREELTRLLTESGLTRRSPEVLDDIRADPDPLRAELRAARALLAEELDRGRIQESTSQKGGVVTARGVENLRQVREIAAKTLQKRPASWQAAMVLGGATYLELGRTGNPAAALDRQRWVAPLELARRLGPGQPEPLRFLTATYLSDWGRLDSEMKTEAVALIQEAFQNPASFDLFLQQWLRVAPSFEKAMEVIPDRPHAWARLRTVYGNNRDWERYCQIHSRWTSARQRELRERVVRAREMSAGGDSFGSRGLLLSVISEAPVRADFEETLGETLSLLPPGPVRRHQVGKLQEWFAWARDRCLAGTCPLSESRIERMVGLAELSGPAQIAEGAVMAGDLAAAELYERRGLVRYTDTWSPYLILKADLLARRGHLEEARASLDMVSTRWKQRGAFRQVVGRMRADTDASSAPDRAPAERVWPSTSWTHGKRYSRLEMNPPSAQTSMEVRFRNVHPDGGVVEVRWNGDLLGFFALRPQGRLKLETRATGGPQLLEILLLEGRYAKPGEVRLRDGV